MKLYYSPGACSMAVHVLLNELNVPFEAVNVSIPEGKNRQPEFLKINPRAQVPVLVDGDLTLREGAAIIIYLLEKQKSPMLPASGPERAKALEWLMYANASMHPAYGKIFFLMHSDVDKSAQEQLIKAASEQIAKMWQEVDAQLAKTPYVCGKDMTAADILLSVFANWGASFPNPISLGGNVKRLLKEISARPAYQKALATEHVEYKAAA